MIESNLRSIVKTITWRITGSTLTMLITYAITGNFVIAGSVAVLQAAINTVAYYIHERTWNLIKWEKSN